MVKTTSIKLVTKDERTQVNTTKADIETIRKPNKSNCRISFNINLPIESTNNIRKLNNINIERNLI